MRKNLLVFFIFIIAISACNLPQAQPTQDPSSAVFTQAAQTVQAQLTQAAILNTPTSSAATPTANIVVPTTAVPTFTLAPSNTPIPCDAAQFVSETIPDGTDYAPGTAFTKTWRLKNIGSCTWTTSYGIIFASGDKIGATSEFFALPGNVPPGAEIDIPLTLIAPAEARTYKGFWKLRNASNVLFGLNAGHIDPFWVQIDVIAQTLNLVDQAASATWITCGDPCAGGTVITFGGPDTNSNGFAMLRNGSKVEDGSTPEKILEMHPMWVDDGVISGEFPAYTVQPNDRFKAKIGFLAKADGTCGTGSVIFQLNYKLGGTLYSLGSWTHPCNGTLITININLNDYGLSGQSVKFALVVTANGSSAQDWAVWINPRVEQ